MNMRDLIPWARKTNGVPMLYQDEQASPFLPHRDRVRGFVYDVETGSLSEVV